MALAGGAAVCFDGGYVLQAYEARHAPRDRALRPSLLVHLARRRLWLAAGAADAWAALATKLVADEIGRGRWGVALAWAAAAGATFSLGLLSEMTALQRLRATRVGPTVLAMQVGLPVALAPLALAESWSG